MLSLFFRYFTPLLQLHLATCAAAVYTNQMASLQKKTVRGHTYWQLVESRRVNGKPRPFVLAHLGKANDLLARLQQTSKPVTAAIRDSAAIAALWKIAAELDLPTLIDQNADKRQQGHGVAAYLLLAAFNRALRPLPKTRLARWYQSTVLPRLLPMPPGSLTSQRFWDHFTYLDAAALDRIEEALSQRLASQYGLDLQALFFDATNFDTFLDSQTTARLPQRGHAKSKRTDLRLVGLALMVSADFHIPLFWHVYPGNQPDSVTFADVLPTLARRHRQLLAGTQQHITLVFDKGNNSQDNLQRLARTPYHVIGSLVPSQHPDLLVVPLERFRRLPQRFGKTWVYRTTKEVFGRPWTIVVTRSQNLLDGQLRGIRQHLAKRVKALSELQDKLAKSQGPHSRGKPYTPEALTKHLQEIIRGQYVADLLHATISRRGGKLMLDYAIDQEAFRQLRRNILGKRLLFTDNAAWSDEQIVEGYRGQHHVERAFRDLKDPALIQFNPLFHWTDSKIRVHAFSCVLALTLVGLLHRQVVQAGVDISRARLLEELKQVRVVTNLYSPAPGNPQLAAGRPRTETVLSERTDLQQRLCTFLQLDPFLLR
jgi:transposase